MTDPYEKNLVGHSFYHSKLDCNANTIVVLEGKLNNRCLSLIKPISRAFSKGAVIELIGTDEKDVKPGTTVNSIAYIGFFEVENTCVVLTGDKVVWNGKVIGEIVGFDDTHMPNHQNTVVFMSDFMCGKDIGLELNNKILITNK